MQPSRLADLLNSWEFAFGRDSRGQAGRAGHRDYAG